jgi:uncharacterized protein (TIGR02266 family)
MEQPLFRNSERRRDPRVGARFDVAFKHQAEAAKAFKAFSVNFSAGGLCLRSQKPHAVGDEVQLVVEVEQEHFELKGTVQWARAGVVGVRFIDVTQEDRERLEKVARTLISRGNPVETEPGTGPE